MKIWDSIKFNVTSWWLTLVGNVTIAVVGRKKAEELPSEDSEVIPPGQIKDEMKLGAAQIEDILVNLAQPADVPSDVIRQLTAYWKANLPGHTMRYWFAVDFTKSSKTKRLTVFDVVTKTYTKHLVAHGAGSEGSWGMATHFSNTPGSHQSSLGIYRVMETYYGKHGKSCRMDGLSPTNSKVRSRDIVLHSAIYVSEAVAAAQGRCGRSDGCFAVSLKDIDTLINKLGGGSLGIAFH